MADSFTLVDRTRKLPALLHTDFLPPKRNLSVVRRWNKTLPSFMRRFCGIELVEIAPDDLARLKALDGRRMLITPNHPTTDDPIMMFALARAAEMPCHYLAAREIFDDVKGLKGKVLQSLGAYSVVRGTPDRESFRMTRELLAEEGGRVVIFPEGEIYSQNDTLLPFQAGVVQLAFWAMDDLRKQGVELPSILLVPVGIRYCYARNMDAAIDEALTELEDALALEGSPLSNPPRDVGEGLRPPTPQSWRNQTGVDGSATSEPVNIRYERLRRIGRTMLETLESEYGLKASGDDGDMSERMNALKSLLLDRAAALIGVKFPEGSLLPERLRILVNAIYAVTRDEPHEKWSPYRERLHREQATRVEPLMQDLNRVANWIAVTDNYVRSNPTQDRMGDNIRRLQIECFGEYKLTGPRRAIIRVGTPIDLADHVEAYKSDKRRTVNRCVTMLENAVQGLLSMPSPASPSPQPARASLGRGS
jgi:1-acyl-sn-glycerol-3-phosphate acyltransferase